MHLEQETHRYIRKGPREEQDEPYTKSPEPDSNSNQWGPRNYYY